MLFDLTIVVLSCTILYATDLKKDLEGELKSIEEFVVIIQDFKKDVVDSGKLTSVQWIDFTSKLDKPTIL